MSTDTTFFTNESNATLLDRFKKTLQTTQYLDVLAGYFRTSGFHRLYDAFEGIEKIRILVGLSVDHKTYEILEEARSNGELDFESHSKTKCPGCWLFASKERFSASSIRIAKPKERPQECVVNTLSFY